jgi:outer membrane protein assembly factor BamB
MASHSGPRAGSSRTSRSTREPVLGKRGMLQAKGWGMPELRSRKARVRAAAGSRFHGLLTATALVLTTVALTAGSGSGAPSGTPFAASPPLAPNATSWPTYLGGDARQSATTFPGAISPGNVSNLTIRWSRTLGGPVDSSPAIVGGTVFIGSQDGYEYALNASTGHQVWKTFLGQDAHGNFTLGVTSSATVVAGTVYVGGGNSYWYALSASTGKVQWKFFTGNISAGFYNWASPLVFGGSAYIGVSSKGDNPLIRGALDEVSLSTHRAVHRFYTTAAGTIGASIWTSPALSLNGSDVLVTTGNPGPNGSAWAESILEFNATTLALVDHWTVPAAQSKPDGDFGATPDVFPGPGGTAYVAASNKNGHVYVWNASNLATGPIWNRITSSASSLVGPPNLGPSAFGGGRLYVGSSKTTLGSTNYSGAVRAFRPTTGALLWQRGEPSGPVLGAPVYVGGVVFVGAGHDFQALNASTGAVLFQNVSSGKFVAAPAIAAGIVVVGATNGVVTAFGPVAHHGPPRIAPVASSSGPARSDAGIPQFGGRMRGGDSGVRRKCAGP